MCGKVMKMRNARKILMVLALLALLVPAGALAQTPSGTLRNTQGGSVPLGQMQGRVAVLLFGGMVDPQSIDELPVLQQLADRFAGRNVVVYWVSLDPAATTDAELTGFATKHGFSGVVLRDPSGDVLKTLSTGRRPQLPTLVVIDANGNLAGRPIGGFDRDADTIGQWAAIVTPLLK